MKQTITYDDILKKLRGAEDKGRYLVAPCPFHSDNSPSLLVFRDGWFRCLAAGCNRVGPWSALWDKIHGQATFLYPERKIRRSPDAITEFSDREELVYQAHRHLVKFHRGWYLEQRGLADAIELHELGYWQGWYTIPVWDADHNFQNVVFRAAPHLQEVTGMRYWADGKAGMYVPDWRLLDTQDYIFIVFGMLDALTLNQLRYPVISPTHGHTFRPEWLDSYRKPIYVIPDLGEEMAAMRLIAKLGWRGQMVNLEYPEGMKDPNDFLKAGREKDLRAQLENVIR